MRAGLPEGVFQVAVGTGETGAALIDEVDMVMFTGSTRTGRKVMERAAQTLTPVSLELGGKDPMIVLADADLERAANAAVYYSMQNGGQTCISIERVYVEAPVYDEFVAKVTEKTEGAAPGPARTAPGSIDVGAMTFPPQLEIVERTSSRRATRARASPPAGTSAPGAGRFYEPTVIADVDHSMTAMTEETFGPTLPVMKVADAEEAIRQANDSPYGLGAAVFTKDLAQGRARRAPDRRRRGLRQRRGAELPGAGTADGRLEGLGPGRTPRPGGPAQVHPPAGADGHALRAQAGDPLLPVQREGHGGDHARHQALLGPLSHAAIAVGAQPACVSSSRRRRRARCCRAWTASTERPSRSATSPGVSPAISRRTITWR